MNKNILFYKLNQVEQNIHDWKSFYQRSNHPNIPRSVEDILGELYSVVGIIGYYLIQMHDSEDCNKTIFNRESVLKFDFFKETSKLFQKGENMPC